MFLNKRILLTVILTSLSSLSYASKADFYFTWGPTFSRLSNNPTVRINDVVTNQYNTSKTTRTSGLVGFGVCHTFENIFHRPFNFSLGLAGYDSNFGTIKGTEHPFVNAGNFDTLDYQFQAESYAIMLEPKLIYTCPTWQPFIMAGIGNAWNHLSDYGEVPSDPSSSAAPLPRTFGSNIKSSFAYEAGIGVQRKVACDNIRGIQYFVSVDYRYMNFGRGQLGGFPALTSGDRLKVSRLDTQAVTLSLTASV